MLEIVENEADGVNENIPNSIQNVFNKIIY